MDELLDFHARHGYYIKVQPIKDSASIGCFAEFPKTSAKTPFILAYLFTNGSLRVIMEKEGDKGDMKTLDVPAYAVRIAILEDIIATTKKLGLSHRIIYWTKNNRRSKINEVIQIDQQSVAKEETLRSVITSDATFNEEHSQFAKSVEVFEGYEVISKIRLTGGICNV